MILSDKTSSQSGFADPDSPFLWEMVSGKGVGILWSVLHPRDVLETLSITLIKGDSAWLERNVDGEA